jgi:hypothetical protein
MTLTLAEKLIQLLFIDYRKAFDTVNSDLLLCKLENYGLSQNALELFRNYFKNRKQSVKLGNEFSYLLDIKLGVPQGSILGPLLFSIFINDLPFFIKLKSKLFADDTTLYDIVDIRNNISLDIAIKNFLRNLEPFLEWCMYDKLDINFKETFFMFISH